MKSGDANNNPHPLKGMTATELAKLPRYYVMPYELSMRDTVSQNMMDNEIANMKEKSPKWLPDTDLEIYVNEFGRTVFQGGLN